MISVDNKLEEFIKKFPSNKNFLLTYKINEEQKTIKEIETKKKEFDNEKENLIKEITEWFDSNVVNLKVSSNHDFKYSLELLEKDHSDYKLLEKCLTPDTIVTNTGLFQ